MLATGEVPRAVKRAGRAGAPSTPGWLGYLAAKRLRDLGRAGSCFLGLCFEGVSFLSVSCGLRANVGISRKVPIKFL